MAAGGTKLPRMSPCALVVCGQNVYEGTDNEHRMTAKSGFVPRNVRCGHTDRDTEGRPRQPGVPGHAVKASLLNAS
jgi:hypothetical protein